MRLHGNALGVGSPHEKPAVDKQNRLLSVTRRYIHRTDRLPKSTSHHEPYVERRGHTTAALNEHLPGAVDT